MLNEVMDSQPKLGCLSSRNTDVCTQLTTMLKSCIANMMFTGEAKLIIKLLGQKKQCRETLGKVGYW